MRKRNTVSSITLGSIVVACAMIVAPHTVIATHQPAARILVYSTAKSPGSLVYPKNWYDDDLPAILSEQGHSTVVTDRFTDPEITGALLSEYDQLWIMSTDTALAGCFAPQEIETIQSFVNTGHGLLVMADHTYPEGGHYYASDANQIANTFGVSFFGLVDHGDGGTGPLHIDAVSHPLLAGVEEITGNRSEAEMSVSGSVVVLATYGGDNLIAVTSYGGGRVVFDVTCQRFWDTEILVGADNPRYAQNIAAWLQGSSASVPSLSGIGLATVATVLLVSGVLGVVFVRRKTVPSAEC